MTEAPERIPFEASLQLVETLKFLEGVRERERHAGAIERVDMRRPIEGLFNTITDPPATEMFTPVLHTKSRRLTGLDGQPKRVIRSVILRPFSGSSVAFASTVPTPALRVLDKAGISLNFNLLGHLPHFENRIDYPNRYFTCKTIPVCTKVRNPGKPASTR